MIAAAVCCAPGSLSARTYVDLARLYPYADAYLFPAYDLDFTSPESVRFLDHRWEAIDPGERSVASRGSAASFRFEAIPMALEMEIDVEPEWPPGVPPGKLVLAVNGRHLASFAAPARAVHRVVLPKERIVTGRNELELRCRGAERFRVRRWRVSPRPAGPRPPAKWFPRGSNVASDRDGMSLRQLPGARIEYFLRLPEGASLAFRVPRRGDPTAAVYRVDVDGGERPSLLRFETAPSFAGDVRLPLPASGDEPVRLTLSVRGPVAGDAADALTWESPRIAVANGDGAAASPPPAADRARPNVVVYVIDALRADHLEPYGYRRDVSPSIAALAKRAVVFEHAYAHSVWTKPCVASLLTGLYPPDHGAIDDASSLSPSVETLATLLKRAGYTTVGLQANGNVGRDFGFGRGFDVFLDAPRIFPAGGWNASRSSRLVDEKLGELADRLREPFFLFVQTIDPHYPYDPEGPDRRWARDPALAALPLEEVFARFKTLGPRDGEAHRAVLDYLVGLYDGDVRHNDRYFGELVALLDRRGLLDRTALFLTADHGEGFHDHGYEVGHAAFFEHTVHVPLIYKPPGGTGGRRSRVPVQHVDVAPTILDLAGVSAEGLPGTSLASLRPEGPPARPIHVLRYRDRKTDRFKHDGRAVIVWPWKLIREDLWAPRAQIFDLEADPRETNDLWRPNDRRCEILLGFLSQRERTLPFAPAPPPARPVELRDSVREQLRQLGYSP